MEEGNLKDQLRTLLGLDKYIPVKTFDVNVDRVDVDNRVCYVSSADGTKSVENLKVRLMPSISDGSFSIPEIDSTVIIAFTDFTEPYVVSYSWLTQKMVNIGNQGWDIKDGMQVLNDGKYGGIPRIINPDDDTKSLLAIINNLEKKVNKLNERLQGVVGQLTGWTTVPQDGGAALQVAMNVWFAANPQPDDLSETTQSDIENPNITHGDKFPE